MGTWSFKTDPPEIEGRLIPINEKALDDPSAEGRKTILEQYSGVENTKALMRPRVRIMTKLMAKNKRRFHKNSRNLSK
jgi:hypothetical protein